MRVLQIEKQGYNGKFDKNGERLYEVLLEGNIELKMGKKDIESQNDKGEFITGDNGKTYEMIIKNGEVTKVIEDPRFI